MSKLSHIDLVAVDAASRLGKLDDRDGFRGNVVIVTVVIDAAVADGAVGLGVGEAAGHVAIEAFGAEDEENGDYTLSQDKIIW